RREVGAAPRRFWPGLFGAILLGKCTIVCHVILPWLIVVSCSNFHASLGLDRDPARLGGFVLGELDPQHAVLEAGLDFIGIDVDRERQHARELAETALLAAPDAFAGRRLLALAFDS